AIASAIRAPRPTEIRIWPSASFACPPVQINAHARPQLRHLVDRIGANRESPKVEIAGRPGGTPARVFALGGNQLNLDSDTPIAKRRYTHTEAVADLQLLDEIFAKVEVDPKVAQVDQSD